MPHLIDKNSNLLSIRSSVFVELRPASRVEVSGTTEERSLGPQVISETPERIMSHRGIPSSDKMEIGRVICL